MEEALATTEYGRRRLAQAEERANQRLAKHVEESDVRPEGKKAEEGAPEGAPQNFGPDIAPNENMHGSASAPLLQPFFANEREWTPMDEWIDEDMEDMDLENGHMIPQTTELRGDMEYPPTTPRGVTVKQIWARAW